MIPQLGASGTTFGTIFLFMTFIAYIFFGPNLEDWSTFIFAIGSAIGVHPNAVALLAWQLVYLFKLRMRDHVDLLTIRNSCCPRRHI
jgi:hypothetical protein